MYKKRKSHDEDL
jgi:hypothetical protein